MCGTAKNFNPHSREGSDPWMPPIKDCTAPISIHTPVKGVTENVVTVIKRLDHFNPHSREGSDQPFKDYGSIFDLISIHTPVKGVT